MAALAAMLFLLSSGAVAGGANVAVAAAPPRPTGDLARLIGPEDYPASALRAGDEGVVAYRIEVSPEGAVAGCFVEASTASPSLERATCALLAARARFAPASDGEGRPVRGSFSGQVTWRLDGAAFDVIRTSSHADYPAAAIAGGEEGVAGFQVDVAADGSVSACTVTASSGSPTLDAATCDLIRTRGRFTAARGADGKPIADTLNGRFLWKLVPSPTTEALSPP